MLRTCYGETGVMDFGLWPTDGHGGSRTFKRKPVNVKITECMGPYTVNIKFSLTFLFNVAFLFFFVMRFRIFLF